MQHRADRRVSPDAYPQQVARNAVRCALQFPSTTFLAHSHCFSRHQNYFGVGPNDDDLYVELLRMQHNAVDCAQFGCSLRLNGRSPYSVSINRRDPSNSRYSPNENAEVRFYVF